MVLKDMPYKYKAKESWSIYEYSKIQKLDLKTMEITRVKNGYYKIIK